MKTKNLAKTKASRHLHTLSESQLKRFRSFLRSPYFNTNHSLVKLFDFLHQPGARFNEKDAYEFIYPGKPFNRNGLKMLRNKLLEQLRSFLHHEALEGRRQASSIREGLMREVALARYYGERSQYEEVLKIRRKNRKSKCLDEDYFLKQFLIEKEVHKARTTQPSDTAAHQSINYPAAINALDKAYSIQKLTYWCQMLAYYQNTRKPLPFPIQADMLPSPEFSSREDVAYSTWMNALRFLLGDTHLYFPLKQLVFSNAPIFSTNDKRNLCGYLQNHTLRDAGLNRFEKATRLFELLQFQFRQGVFQDFNFTPGIFWIMLQVSFTLERLDWLDASTLERARTFRDAGSEIFLAKRALNEGRVSQAEKWLDEAEALIGHVDHLLEGLKMALIHTMKNQVYYEKKEKKRFRSSINRFKTFLSTKRKFYRLIPTQRRDIIEGNRGFNNRCAQLWRFNEAAARRTDRIAGYKKVAGKIFQAGAEAYQEEWLQHVLTQLLPASVKGPLSMEQEQLKQKFHTADKAAFSLAVGSYRTVVEQQSVALHKHHRQAADNFAHYLEKAYTLSQLKDIQQLEELEWAICREPLLIGRAWLLKRLLKLKEGNENLRKEGMGKK